MSTICRAGFCAEKPCKCEARINDLLEGLSVIAAEGVTLDETKYDAGDAVVMRKMARATLKRDRQRFAEAGSSEVEVE